MPPEDERLLRARAGDDRAFAEIVRRHQSMVFSLALRVIGNRALAEELAQDAFLQLHRSLPALESGAHVVHWLRRVISHRAIDLARQLARQRHTSLSDLAEPAARGASLLSGGRGDDGSGVTGGRELRSWTSAAVSGGSSAASPDDQEIHADPFLARRLRDLVATLPPAPRAVVTLRFQEDLELSEIAAVLDMPLNTVKSHLRRSLILLRGRAQALLEPMPHVSRS